MVNIVPNDWSKILESSALSMYDYLGQFKPLNDKHIKYFYPSINSGYITTEITESVWQWLKEQQKNDLTQSIYCCMVKYGKYGCRVVDIKEEYFTLMQLKFS